MSNQNNKKVLAEQLKAKLNSSEYVEMPDLITYEDGYADMLTWFGKRGWISGTNINPGKGNKHKSEHIVCREELEKNDWEEIASLVEKRREEKWQLYEQKQTQILEKLKNTPNLYYRYVNNKRNSTSYFVYPDKEGEYFGLRGFENGQEYWLNININHSILNDFPWQKIGYYLIETDKQIERNDKFGRPWSDGGESNPNNFHKWIEMGDQITITPYETVDKPSKKPQKDNSNILLQSNQKLLNKETTEDLLKYFRENDIKEVSLKDNKNLVITHNNNNNNNEIISFEQIDNNSEIRNVKNYLQITNQKSLNLQQLQGFAGSPISPQTDYTPYLIGGGIVFGLGLLAACYLVGKKYRHK